MEGTGSKTLEQKEIKKFDWRDYSLNPETLPQELVEKLDYLADLINQGGKDTEDFLEPLHRGNYSQPLMTLVNFYRDLLNPAERKQLLDAVEKAGHKRIKLDWRIEKSE